MPLHRQNLLKTVWLCLQRFPDTGSMDVAALLSKNLQERANLFAKHGDMYSLAPNADWQYEDFQGTGTKFPTFKKDFLPGDAVPTVSQPYTSCAIFQCNLFRLRALPSSMATECGRSRHR
jgi:hypothetical protein